MKTNTYFEGYCRVGGTIEKDGNSTPWTGYRIFIGKTFGDSTVPFKVDVVKASSTESMTEALNKLRPATPVQILYDENGRVVDIRSVT